MKNPIFVAIDTTDIKKAKDLIHLITPYVGGIKIGLEFFTRHGIAGVEKVMPKDLPLFLDLKFHDIPNTVYGAVSALNCLDIFMLTVHASGDVEMMKSAKQAADYMYSKPKVLGVTVLTSIEKTSVMQDVINLTRLAKEANIDGIVCSGNEITIARQKWKEAIIVTPGIRITYSEDDQKRVVTPKFALDKGSDYLVIGRPITESKDTVATIKQILVDINYK